MVRKSIFTLIGVAVLLVCPIAHATAQTTAAFPSHIAIKAGGVNARIVDVGITSTGHLDVPPNFVEAGWYKYGPMPGQLGSSVIDGHVDNGGKVPGPFKNLKKVQKGDDITVTDDGGKTLHFTVRDVAVYGTEKFPSNLIFNEKGSRLLKIITCHGAWVPSQKTYSQRLVVTAVLNEA